MLQRIAKAIHASLVEAPWTEADTEWERLSPTEQAAHITAARRVLHVMRWPSEAMLAEGKATTARDAGNIWEVMIYRALHEEG